jgi:two-component system nitrogen regulation response regulator GlnG
LPLAVTDADKTLTTPLSVLAHGAAPLLGLTLLWHPELQRVGQQYLGPGIAGRIELNRFLPLFQHPGQEGAALGHRCIARSPLQIQRQADDSVVITAPASGMALAIDNQRVTQRAAWCWDWAARFCCACTG